MPHFMSHSDMRDRWRDMFSIIQKRNDTSVKTLQSSSVMLKNEREKKIKNNKES